MALEHSGRQLILYYRTSIVALVFFCISFLLSCEGADPDSPAQPKLQTTKLRIGPHQVIAECAVTEKEASHGMMFRKNMPDNHGMLFFLKTPRRAGFWMKNTLIPLSIAYIDESGKILEIYRMTPHDTTPVTSSSFRVKYALEMNQGWFQKNGVQPGELVKGIPKF